MWQKFSAFLSHHSDSRSHVTSSVRPFLTSLQEVLPPPKRTACSPSLSPSQHLVCTTCPHIKLQDTEDKNSVLVATASKYLEQHRAHGMRSLIMPRTEEWKQFLGRSPSHLEPSPENNIIKDSQLLATERKSIKT